MAPTPMDVNSPRPTTSAGLTKPSSGLSKTAKISEVIQTYRPTRQFRRTKHTHPTTIFSLDFSPSGELLLTSESDESLQIYNTLSGDHKRSFFSQKYGCALGKFTHHASSILYASTKENNDVRYMSTHDNTYIRYFTGHKGKVSSLTMHPGMDSFVSASAEDGSVRIWDLNSPHASGRLNFVSPNLVAFDPSANVLAVSSGVAQSILLYDFRMYDKEPFATFDMLSDDKLVAPGLGLNTPDWTKLEFSNDGKSLLVGTNGRGHFLLDAFDGSLKHLLVRSAGGPHRLAAGETPTPPSDGAPSTSADTPLSSGDVTFTPDGRYVLSGQAGKPDVLVYDAHKPPQRANGTGDAPSVALMPEFELEASGTNGVVETGVLAFNPRFNMFASADKEVVFWVPDRDV